MRADPAPRLAFLDGVRAIAASYVVLHHAVYNVYPELNSGGWARLFVRSFGDGQLAVVVFIVVSGFSLGLGAVRNGLRLRQDYRAFVRRRFDRIVPTCLAALAVALVLSLTVISKETGTHWDYAVPFSLVSALAHVFLLQDFVGWPYAIDYPMWSIAIEWHIYFLFPLVLLLCRSVGVLAGSLGLLAVAAIGEEVINSRVSDFLGELGLVGGFALGIAAVHIVHNDGRVVLFNRAVRPPWHVLALLCGLAWLVVPLNDVTFAIASACLLIGLATGQAAWLRRVLELRPMLIVGLMSYSLYLIHAPILQVVWQYVLDPLGFELNDGVSMIVMLLVGFAASLGAARLLFELVEKRALPPGMLEAERGELRLSAARTSRG